MEARQSETDIRTSLFLWQTSSIHVRKLAFFFPSPPTHTLAQPKPSSFSLINHLQSFIQHRLSCFLAAGLTASDKIDLLQSIPNSYTRNFHSFSPLHPRAAPSKAAFACVSTPPHCLPAPLGGGFSSLRANVACFNYLVAVTESSLWKL